MQLHQFTQSVGARKKPQRIGRGGKRGTTSGRGQKGQKSRSGHRIRPAVRDLIQRLPKLRGFANKNKSAPHFDLSIGKIESRFKKFATGKNVVLVNMEALRETGLVPVNFYGTVKVLSGGEITTAMTLKGLKVSAIAKEKIEKAGGKVE